MKLARALAAIDAFLVACFKWLCVVLFVVLTLIITANIFVRYVPVMVVASLIWRWILNPEQGFLNYLIYSMGLATPQTAPHWMRWIKDPQGGAMLSIRSMTTTSPW